jgi:RND superfamily putative drug exporter
VLGFQKGWLTGVLDFRSTKGLEPSNLVVLFTLAFALASDYGVFLLGRIKEAHDAGLPDREAIAQGLERTGRLVTAAALLFCVAMGALASASVLSLKELGFGAALAVAIDASIVRAMLVPSVMAIMGRWNWAAPSWMRRLHSHIGISEGGANMSTGALPAGAQPPAVDSERVPPSSPVL